MPCRVFHGLLHSHSGSAIDGLRRWWAAELHRYGCRDCRRADGPATASPRRRPPPFVPRSVRRPR